MSKERIYTTSDGFTGNIAQIAKRYGLYYQYLHKALKTMTIDEALRYFMEHKRKVYTTKDGFTGNIREISNHYNINENVLRVRLQRGKTIDEAINYNRFKIYTTKEIKGTLTQIADYYNINYILLFNRLNKGMNIDEAIEDIINSKRCYMTYTTSDGFTGNSTQIAEHYNIIM